MTNETKKRIIKWAIRDRIEDLKHVLKDLTDKAEIRLVKSYIKDHEEVLKEIFGE